MVYVSSESPDTLVESSIFLHKIVDIHGFPSSI